MYLIFDTETTGFYNANLANDHPDQGRIVQLGALLYNKDFREIASFYSLVKPDGWSISPGAQAVHGITIEECEKYGLPIKQIVDIVIALYEKSRYIVAHNLSFDANMLDVEMALLGVDANIDWDVDGICTMHSTTNLCRLPKPSGKSGYKWPKLAEAHALLLREVFTEHTHDAIADCRACGRVFKYLVTTGQLKLNID